MAKEIVYVVCGQVREIEAWRRTYDIPRRQVRAVSTTGPAALRGLSLPAGAAVVELPSWSSASQRVREELAVNLALARVASKAL